MTRIKYGRRECEICERRVTNVAPGLAGIMGDCPEHGRVPAWITGIRQNAISAREEAVAQ